MIRSVAILLTILLALYLLVHYAMQEPKPVAPKPAPLPPLMNVGATFELPTFVPAPPSRADGLIGCFPRPEAQPAATPALETRLYAALRKVARYRSFVKTNPSPAYVLDEQKAQYFVAAIGENHDTHFVRCHTLRVWTSGRVDHLEPIEGKWVPLISAQAAVRSSPPKRPSRRS